MATKTPNVELNIIENIDTVSQDLFNQNTEIIDTELGKLEVNLTDTEQLKEDMVQAQSDINSLSTRVTNNAHNIADVATDVATKLSSTQVQNLINAAVNALVDGAPNTLDTLKEIADALQSEQTATGAITAALASKVDKVDGKGLSTNDYDAAAKGKVDKIAVTAAVNLDTIASQSHTHANKALLDSYTQTEANLADAVSKKHSHANKAVLDSLTDSSGKLLYGANIMATKQDAIKFALIL